MAAVLAACAAPPPSGGPGEDDAPGRAAPSQSRDNAEAADGVACVAAAPASYRYRHLVLRDGAPEPATAREAIASLRALTSEDQARALACADLSAPPRGLRSLKSWVRNEWLHGDSALARHLASRGARHPDDMSAVIVEGLMATMRGAAFDVDAAIARQNARREASRDGQGA